MEVFIEYINYEIEIIYELKTYNANEFLQQSFLGSKGLNR